MQYLSPICHPITTKRRKYSKADHSFIYSHISQPLENDINETSTSPWQAQVVVVKNNNKNMHMH